MLECVFPTQGCNYSHHFPAGTSGKGGTFTRKPHASAALPCDL